MSKELKNITGIDIPNFPLSLTKVGDLIYFEGSLMSVYKDENNVPYIFDWVDSDSETNRWLVYQTSCRNLSDYIYKRISHYTFIQLAINDLYFLIDKDLKDNINCKIITLKYIPNSYLPKSTIYFDEEETINLETIIQTFNLQVNSKVSPEDNEFNILEEAQKNQTELINLHLKSNNSKVGYGKIRTSVLGEVLVNFQKLTTAVAISAFDGKDKTPKEKRTRRKSGQLDFAKELGETEYLYSKAASFSVFLKPIKQTFDIYDKVSSEIIADSIFTLFEVSKDLTTLKTYKENLDNGVLASYNNFLKSIREEDIMVTVQYANPSNLVTFKDRFDKIKAINIINNLKVAEVDSKEELRTSGQFTALDRTKYTFKFYSSDKEEYEGKFSSQLKGGMHTYNLKDFYNVTFEIEEVNISGKIENKENIVMVSCVKLEEDNN